MAKILYLWPITNCAKVEKATYVTTLTWRPPSARNTSLITRYTGLITRNSA
jgi:hypothetical protein